MTCGNRILAGSIFSTFEKVNQYYSSTYDRNQLPILQFWNDEIAVGTRSEYKGNKTIIHVRPTRTLCRCPHCHSYTLLENGTRERQIQALPIGPTASQADEPTL